MDSQRAESNVRLVAPKRVLLLLNSVARIEHIYYHNDMKPVTFQIRPAVKNGTEHYPMPTRADELNRVEEAILDELGTAATPMSPYELVAALKKRDLKEDIIRAAMWYLIDRQKIDLTRERLLFRPA